MSKVAILKTSPGTVIGDYNLLIHLADCDNFLLNENRLIIKLNLSWSLYYPACSTSPWQLEGVLNALWDESYKDIVAVENQTEVTHPKKGAYYNKWLTILNKNEVEFQPLTDVKWVPYKPKTEMLAMYDIFDEILIPKIFVGSNIIHLSTVKTHGHTSTTGAMKDASGGVIPKYRHHAHKKIHKILVDLLAIQKEIHKGIFRVMDGCVGENGAGPRTMEPFVGNVILASEDPVAIDAIAAKIMGFEPLKIDYIKMAHDRGLGIGDIDQIEIVGMEKKEFEKLNFDFRAKKSPIIDGNQIFRMKTANIKWLHHLLFYSPIFKTFIFASEFYQGLFWYPVIGKRMIKEFMKTEWGKLLKKYPHGEFPEYEEVKEWNLY